MPATALVLTYAFLTACATQRTGDLKAEVKIVATPRAGFARFPRLNNDSVPRRLERQLGRTHNIRKCPIMRTLNLRTDWLKYSLIVKGIVKYPLMLSN